MGRYYHRPLYAVDYGDVETVGSGVVLGDNNDSTFKRYFEDSGSVLVYPDFNDNVVPFGKEIIAVRCGHRQRNTGVFGLYNGWVATFLRISNQRQAPTKAYKQDGYIDAGREILGAPLYKPNYQPWTEEEITLMSTDSGAAVGEIGPSGNRWCVCSESFIQVVWDEPVPMPNTPYPANGQTIATSSVNFSAVIPAPQEEQPVRTVFQVARDPDFTVDVRTFVGGLNRNTAAGSKSIYTSEIDEDTYTDLGPGTWYLRMRGRDMRGAPHESAWSATTSFSIVHAALPVPSLTEPQPGTTVPTPYGMRRAQFTTQPAGERRVGVHWQFSKDPTFGTGVVQWENRNGILFASAEAPGIVSYNPQPDANTASGGHGATVSVDDPSQYLSQGSWYARVRAADAYGQYGAWSGNFAFSVAHKPVPASPVPRNNAAFDQHAGPVTWTFTDPYNGDAQSAYQMKVYTTADLLLQDTGKVFSSVARAVMSIPAQHLQENLKYSLDVWDLDDVKSASPVTAFFRLSLSPVITVPYPQPDEQIISGQPEITWSVQYAHAGASQKSFRIRFYATATGVLVFDSGTVLGTATSYLPPRPILRNATQYTMSVQVTDTDDLTGETLRTFSTNFERPAYVPGYADSTVYRDSGYVEVFWPGGVPDGFFLEWRIYRRRKGTEEWILAGAVSDPAVKYFRDWLVAGADEFEYSITQAATRFGSIVESEQNDFPDSVSIYSDSYWFIVPDDEEMNMQLLRVTGDKFADRMEVNDFIIKGRGRKRNFGTHIGKEGNLTVSIRHSANRTATEQLYALRQLSHANIAIIMRDPYGNLTRIALGEINTDRLAGVGHSEFADLDIPYYEVAE